MPKDTRTKWEKLEEWLFDHGTQRFSSADVAHAFNCTGHEASLYIQAYLVAQRREDSSALYMLKREGRTSKALWSVGERKPDAHDLGVTLYEDVRVKVRGPFAKDLRQLAARNPRAARYVERKLEAVVEGALTVLAASLDYGDGEDD